MRVNLDLGCRSGSGLVAPPGGEGRSVRGGEKEGVKEEKERNS